MSSRPRTGALFRPHVRVRQGRCSGKTADRQPRARSTRSRMAAELPPARRSVSCSCGIRGTSRWISMRSEEWTAGRALVAGSGAGGAGAGPARVAVVAARARGFISRNEGKFAGSSACRRRGPVSRCGPPAAGAGPPAWSRRTPQLVQKEHAPVREADLTRTRPGAATHQPDIAGGVMRRAEEAAPTSGVSGGSRPRTE